MKKIFYILSILFLCGGKSLFAQCAPDCAPDDLSDLDPTAINQSLVVGNSTTDPFPLLELDLGTEENPWRSLYFTEEGAAFIYLYDALFMHNTGGTISGGFSTGVFLGENAGENVTTGANGNVGIGYQAMQNSMSGSHNTAVGWLSLKFLATTADKNTMIGSRAGQAILEGEMNTGVGWNVFYDDNINTTGSITGNRNVGIGGEVFKSLVDGSNNTVVGHASGLSIVKGSNNLILGQDAGNDLVGTLTGQASNNIIIGYQQELGAEAAGEMNIGGVIYSELDEGQVSIGNSSGMLANTFNVGTADEFQISSAGKIEQYNDLTTAGNGVAAILDVYTKTGTTTNETYNFLAPVTGEYRISFNLNLTTVATIPYVVLVRVEYTDDETGTITTIPSKDVRGFNQIISATSANVSVGSALVIYARANTNITIKTVQSGGPQYSIRTTIEKL